MNRTALYALLIALIIPVCIFFYVSSLPKAAVPQPLFSDSVSTKVSKGKEVQETYWHHIPNFKLTNQLGEKISFSDISLSDSGRIVVANFFFTHCTSICPAMTMEMKKLQNTVQRGVRIGDNTADYVQYLSFSIDPETDSVPNLKKWADRFQIDPVNWWLLTGDKQTIYDLSLKHMNLSVQDPKIDSAWPHTDIFVLIDKHGVVRARRDKDGNPKLYHSRDEQDMRNLAEDIVLLSLEKGQGQKGPLAGQLPLILTVMLIALGGVILLFFIFRKK